MSAIRRSVRHRLQHHLHRVVVDPPGKLMKVCTCSLPGLRVSPGLIGPIVPRPRGALTERIEELIARRDPLHRLADGDGALLPDRAVALLKRMLGLGFLAEEVAARREGWVLAKALVPEGFDDYLTHFEHAMQDTRLVALTNRVAGRPRCRDIARTAHVPGRVGRDRLGSAIADVRFRAGRIDAVWGVGLQDSRAVVIKAHRTPVDLRAAKATIDAQARWRQRR